MRVCSCMEPWPTLTLHSTNFQGRDHISVQCNICSAHQWHTTVVRPYHTSQCKLIINNSMEMQNDYKRDEHSGESVQH